jgi:hypothetical protein
LGNAPNTPLIARESSVAVLDTERLAVITATTPLLMALSFDPDTKHTKVPTPAVQLIVFPAAVSAEPAVTLSEVTAVGEYPIVHWSPAGALAAALNERFSESEVPWRADPEAKLSDGA